MSIYLKQPGSALLTMVKQLSRILSSLLQWVYINGQKMAVNVRRARANCHIFHNLLLLHSQVLSLRGGKSKKTKEKETTAVTESTLQIREHS